LTSVSGQRRGAKPRHHSKASSRATRWTSRGVDTHGTGQDRLLGSSRRQGGESLSMTEIKVTEEIRPKVKSAVPLEPTIQNTPHSICKKIIPQNECPLRWFVMVLLIARLASNRNLGRLSDKRSKFPLGLSHAKTITMTPNSHDTNNKRYNTYILTQIHMVPIFTVSP
jgi:hypothetical protein